MPTPTEPIVTARLDLGPLWIADADEMIEVLAVPGLYAFTGVTKVVTTTLSSVKGLSIRSEPLGGGSPRQPSTM